MKWEQPCQQMSHAVIWNHRLSGHISSYMTSSQEPGFVIQASDARHPWTYGECMIGCHVRARLSIQPFHIRLIAWASLCAEIVTLAEITLHDFFRGILHLRGWGEGIEKERERYHWQGMSGSFKVKEISKYCSPLCFGESKLRHMSHSQTGLIWSEQHLYDEATSFLACSIAHQMWALY